MQSIFSAMAFKDLERFRLDGVTVTDKELGHGSFAVVLLADLRGAACAVKRIHPVIRGGDVLRRFAEECTLLSELRHPNIVQFLGVHFDDDNVPLLVMEYLPTSLVKYIGDNGRRTLSYEANCYVFRDVAVALHYLHTHSPVVLHRDLTANNVLLLPTSRNRWCAKISDVGVARMLETETSPLTQAPGTPAYMPPEALVAKPNYTDKIDVFSFGVLMIHALVGTCPVPSVANQPDPHNPGRLIALNEVERRKQYLDELEPNHPLRGLIHYCIHNDPNERPASSQIADKLRSIVQPFEDVVGNDEDVFADASSDPPSFQSQSSQENHPEKQTRTRLPSVAGDHAQQIMSLSIENGKLKSQLNDLTTQCNLQKAQLRQSGENHQRELSVYRESLERQKTNNQKEIAALRERVKTLQSDISELKKESSSMQFDISSRDRALAEKTNEVDLKEARITTLAMELEAKNLDLERLTALGTQLNTQLSKATALLAAKTQVHPFNPMAQISWEILPSLPVAMSYAQTVVINGKVYVGGGRAVENENNYKVFCFDPVNNAWKTLASDCPVRWFGLGEFGGQLVAVGGMQRDDTLTSAIHAFDEGTKTWKKCEIPDMKVARNFCAVLNFKSPDSVEEFLIVAGGSTLAGCTTAVEIYESSSGKWCAAQPLLYPCYGISTAYISGTWYLSCRIIENRPRHRSDEILYSSVSRLIQSVKPANYNPFEDPCQPQVWKTFTNTAVYTTAIGSIGGALLAIGGIDRNFEFFQRFRRLYNNVDIYLPSKKVWVRLDNPSDLPPNIWAATAALSPTMLLVIGGQNTDEEQMDSVYKITLTTELDT